MKIKVTSRGVTIPRRMLSGAKEVEVRQEEARIVLLPLADDGGPPPADDPIWEFGKDPVDFGVTDASVNHDKYLADEAADDHTS
ncbi:MAG: hypothetical protein M3552_18025 [Planctomycetota bacterium]|nr:hypothetical protein [Planctomycetaceae bacterium]MDQ3332518.1 hypothetical protein [Planctomycetota bacterium]